MSQRFLLETIAQRLEQEEGTLFGQGRRGVALVYPSPYSVAMSSLGYQTIYRLLNGMPDTHAERAFLPEEGMSGPLLTYESRRPVGDFPVIAFSVSYELEIAGAFQCLASAGVPLLREQRTRHDPWVVMGGPLTFSNPSPLAPFADVVPMGEAEELLAPLLERLLGGLSREEALRAVADVPGYYVPAVHGEAMPAVAQCDNALLPACSAIITPNTALSSMFLVEVERGCSRGCTFCVMRRSTNGGMRVVPVDRVLATIPAHARKVGFVGAAVSDHPRIVNILRAMVESGREVGLSSLRADRLTPEFVELLVRGGYRTLTVASDGASERLRSDMEKRIREKHLLRAAEYAGAAGVAQLKNYMMIGVPGETDADLDELIAFTLQQAKIAGPRVRVSLGIAPFVAKRNTPLDGVPFVGIAEAERRLERLRRGLMPRVEVRPTSARWAWIEYLLAQGGPEAGLAALEAWRQGGSFAAWKRAFKPYNVPVRVARLQARDVVPVAAVVNG
jgi:radical SAM superfamily enzyme YgiQ (UPF0313 family)